MLAWWSMGLTCRRDQVRILARPADVSCGTSCTGHAASHVVMFVTVITAHSATTRSATNAWEGASLVQEKL